MPEVKTLHLYITESPDILGGEPVIKGTRISVRSVVQYILRQGMTPEEFVKEFSQVDMASVYDALSYYYDHKKEIDTYIEMNRENYWEK